MPPPWRLILLPSERHRISEHLPALGSAEAADEASGAGGTADSALVETVQEREQRALAEFIAKRWRIAETAATSFVSIAYRAGKQHSVDPVLILSVMAIESRYNPVAESVVGAKGLMQIIPKYHLDKLLDHGGEEALLDPEVNIQVGAQILREYYRRFGDQETALQMYAGAFDEPTSRYAAQGVRGAHAPGAGEAEGAQRRSAGTSGRTARSRARLPRGRPCFACRRSARSARCRWRRSRRPGVAATASLSSSSRAKRLRIAAAVGVDVEGAVRLGRNGQARPSSAPAPGSRAAARTPVCAPPVLETSRWEKAATAACCAAAGRRDEQMLRELLEAAHRASRQHHPAQPPAGHAEVLREAVDDAPLRPAGRARSTGSVP